MKLSATAKEPLPMSKSKSREAAKRVLALPDLEHAKTAVLNSLTSASGQRTNDHDSRVRRLVLFGAADSGRELGT
jgi:hypothetical protein